MACVDPLLEDLAACASANEAKAGHGATLSICPIADIASMPVLPALASNTTNEAYGTATGTFTCKTGKKFTKVGSLNDFTEISGESVGSKGNLDMKYSPKVRLQNTAATLGLLKKIMNIPMVLTAVKAGGLKVIYGDLDFPVQIESVAEKNDANENYIEVTLSGPSAPKAFFAGTIPYTAAA